ATEEAHRVRSDLSSRLAEAFERYENNRVLLGYYSQYILPDQVRAYRGVYERHQQEPDKVGFADVVSAQQTLAAVVSAYVTTLGATWTAVTDVANLLQTNDLFQTGQEQVTPVPDLEQLGPLPCSHPCSPLPDPGLMKGDGTWPRAAPEEAGKSSPAPDNRGAADAPSATDFATAARRRGAPPSSILGPPTLGLPGRRP